MKNRIAGYLAGIAVATLLPAAAADAQTAPAFSQTWRDTSLSPDARAALVVAAMTLDEKIAMLHGTFGSSVRKANPADKRVGAGHVPGSPRLGITNLYETDASLGIANGGSIRPGDVATALPSSLATAASFDPAIAYAGGAMIGAEARAKGFNVLLAGGVNLTRDPWNGRNFEYLGEDVLLSGVMAGESIRGVQSNGVVSTIKHFALNAPESGCYVLDARMTEAALRESDLLAFQIVMERGRPGSVMCGYNKINGARAGSDNDDRRARHRLCRGTDAQQRRRAGDAGAGRASAVVARARGRVSDALAVRAALMSCSDIQLMLAPLGSAASIHVAASEI